MHTSDYCKLSPAINRIRRKYYGKKRFSFDLFGSNNRKATYRNLVTEAKEAGFGFRVFKKNISVIDPIPSNQVEIDTEKIEFLIENAPFSIPLSELTEVQTLPKSKIVNLIVTSGNIWETTAAMLPSFIALLSILIIGSSEKLMTLLPNPSEQDFFEGFGLALALTAGILMISSFMTILRTQENLRMQAVTTGGLRTVIKRLEEASDEEEYFSRLIQVNLRNIEDYYNLVQKQSDKSYRLTQGGAIAGFGVLLIGIVLSFFQGMNQTSTALTIASGTLIEFISAIFFYLYNKTIQQLSEYHDKLIKVQDTMLALRVAQGIKNDESMKNETMRYLTEALTSGLFEKYKSKTTAYQENKDKPNTTLQSTHQTLGSAVRRVQNSAP